MKTSTAAEKTVAVYPVPRVDEEHLTALQRSGEERMIQ